MCSKKYFFSFLVFYFQCYGYVNELWFVLLFFYFAIRLSILLHALAFMSISFVAIVSFWHVHCTSYTVQYYVRTNVRSTVHNHLSSIHSLPLPSDSYPFAHAHHLHASPAPCSQPNFLQLLRALFSYSVILLWTRVSLVS